MSQDQPVEHLLSAGGVVYRDGGNEREIVLCGRKSPVLWALPKGTPDAGETREQTAVREVREETGLDVHLECFIDKVEYWFVRPFDKARCHKTVLFYLMSPTGGDVSLHDHEFDDVRWFPVDEALKLLTYGNEARIAEKGLSMVAK
ncbi:MAG: NUDIX hydrolase [SAR202 cluster bacterium]|nr:NUDIX hydrolase [SAR202 cluster bacterium]